MLKDYLDGKSIEQVTELSLAALRAWYRHRPLVMPGPDLLDEPFSDLISMNGDLGLWFARLVRTEGLSVDEHNMKEAFGSAQHLAWMSTVMEFVWWLERSGLAIPLRTNMGVVHQLRLTARGIELLRVDDLCHPLLSNGLYNIQTSCPSLPEGTIAQLVDARACVDHSLFRASVVLIGVAYETAIEAIVEHLEPLGVLKKKANSAGERISAIRDAIEADRLPAFDGLDKASKNAAKLAAHDACVFADSLRARRNTAAHVHTVNDFAHRGETEEWFVSAGRHLVALWSVRGDEPADPIRGG